MIDRRMFMGAVTAALAFATVAQGALPAAEKPLVRVVRSPGCGCCGAWIDHLREAGFDVEVTMSDDVAAFKEQHEVPRNVWSFHTARVEGYLVEGHVPAEAIFALLDQRPTCLASPFPACRSARPAWRWAIRQNPSVEGERTVSELAAEYGVHPTMIHQWKKALLEGAADILERRSRKPAEVDEETVRP